MTEDKFTEGIEILLNCGLRYEREPNKTLIKTWWNLLKNISDNDWLNIITYWIANETDFPTIADLLRTQKEMVKKIDVRSEIRKADFGRNDCDPVVQEAVRKCGGWYRLGNMTDKDYDFAIKDIEERYAQLVKEERFNLLTDRKFIGD